MLPHKKIALISTFQGLGIECNALSSYIEKVFYLSAKASESTNYRDNPWKADVPEDCLTCRWGAQKLSGIFWPFLCRTGNSETEET